MPGYIFHGKKGSFIKSKADIQERDLLNGKLPNSENWGIEPENEKGLLHTEKNGIIIKEFVDTKNGNYMEYYDAIYNAIRNNAKIPVTGEDAKNVIAIIEASMKSNEEKKMIVL